MCDPNTSSSRKPAATSTTSTSTTPTTTTMIPQTPLHQQGSTSTTLSTTSSHHSHYDDRVRRRHHHHNHSNLQDTPGPAKVLFPESPSLSSLTTSTSATSPSLPQSPPYYQYQRHQQLQSPQQQQQQQSRKRRRRRRRRSSHYSPQQILRSCNDTVVSIATTIVDGFGWRRKRRNAAVILSSSSFPFSSSLWWHHQEKSTPLLRVAHDNKKDRSDRCHRHHPSSMSAVTTKSIISILTLVMVYGIIMFMIWSTIQYFYDRHTNGNNNNNHYHNHHSHHTPPLVVTFFLESSPSLSLSLSSTSFSHHKHHGSQNDNRHDISSTAMIGDMSLLEIQLPPLIDLVEAQEEVINQQSNHTNHVGIEHDYGGITYSPIEQRRQQHQQQQDHPKQRGQLALSWLRGGGGGGDNTITATGTASSNSDKTMLEDNDDGGDDNDRLDGNDDDTTTVVKTEQQQQEEEEEEPIVVYAEQIPELDDEFDEFFGRDDDYIKGFQYVGAESEDDDDDQVDKHDQVTDTDHMSSKRPSSAPKFVATGCRETAKHRELHPNCNGFHEMNLLEMGLKYIGHGDYRAAGIIEHKFQQETENVIFKHIHYNDMGYPSGYESTRADTLVSDLMSFSPRIVHVYGLCGYSTTSEFLPYGDIYQIALPGDDGSSDSQSSDDTDEEEEEEKTTTQGWTDESILLVDDKLYYALQIAEAIQDLHSMGIVHQDLKMDQILFTSSNKTEVKLNDFNKATMMLWNDESNEYCKYSMDETRRWRSPEEYKDRLMNEKVDVFNYGMMLYVLLTGKWYSDDPRNKDVAKGKQIYLPNDYYQGAEQFLVNLIHKCRSYNMEDRPTMLDIIDQIKTQQRERDLVPR